ncbi:MAG: ATP-binding protein [Congregibacter sp.]
MVQQATLYPAFEAYETQSALGTVARVRDALEAELAALDILNTEYSYWDDVYVFAQGKAPSFPDEYLRETYLQDSNVDLFLIFDLAGKELFRFVDGIAGELALPLDELLLEPLSPGHPVMGPADDDTARVYGYLQTARGLMQIVSYPIVKTSGEGEPTGSLTTGKYLTRDRMAALTELFVARISLFRPNIPDLPKRVKDAQFALAFDPGGAHVGFAGESALGYFLVSDVFGRPAGIFEITAPDPIAPIAARAINGSTLLMAAASILFVFAAWLLARRFVITPISKLSAEIARIRETGTLDVEIETHRSDEIGVLATDFQALASELRGVQSNLEHTRDEAIAASKMKSEFLARMSHEIRTPMNGVLGMTELLRNTTLSAKQDHLAATIQESGASLLAIINNILDFSKIEAGKLEVELVAADLSELIESTVSAFRAEATGKDLSLTYSIEPRPRGVIYLDPIKLRQVLTNLIGNAIKFTNDGGVVISVSCKHVSDDSVIARFEVADTGIGIKPEKQALIFDSFSQVDETTTRLYGGTGLGLSISKQLVELMGGELQVRSAPGQGAVFFFELSLQRPSELPTAA